MKSKTYHPERNLVVRDIWGNLMSCNTVAKCDTFTREGKSKTPEDYSCRGLR